MENSSLRIPQELGGGMIDTRSTIQPVFDYQHALAPIQRLSATVPTATATVTATAINRTVKVVDEFGDPLPGAHIYFSQNSGTTTNFDGIASLSGDGNREVHISYVGFKPAKYLFKSLPSTVKLIMDSELGEVFITAPAKSAAIDSKVPKYLFPAIGGIALLLILMSMAGSQSGPKEVTL